MIRSMTGFGEADVATAAGRLRVELRSVNHRYLNVSTKLPSAMLRWDGEIREWLRKYFARGAVNVSVRLMPDGAGAALGLRIDGDRVAAYLSLFRELGSRFGVAGEPDLSLITRFSDIFVRDDSDADVPGVSAEELREAIDGAAEAMLVMRRDEGKRLQQDLENRLAAIESSLEVIEAAAPLRLSAERDRLRAAVAELAEGHAIDETRIAQEIAMLAERWDINEELVRFRSHIELFRELLASDSADGVGKRLSFLVQEMHREANTTGSKSNSAAISHQVVAVKEEIERLREQVENVE
jgi:uncharacterized protein (TIGR00255 family)